jgi:hypothetical protein
MGSRNELKSNDEQKVVKIFKKNLKIFFRLTEKENIRRSTLSSMDAGQPTA